MKYELKARAGFYKNICLFVWKEIRIVPKESKL